MRVYKLAARFKRKYPNTIAIRLKKHAEVIERVIDKDEQVLYVFCGQRNDTHSLLFDSCIVALTNKRIIIGEKRALFGYYLINVKMDLYNDLKLSTGIFWGKIEIDTVKETVFISNLDKRSLDEIETNINKVVAEYKKRISNEVNPI